MSRTIRGGHSRTSKKLSDRQRGKKFSEPVGQKKEKKKPAKRSREQIAFDELEADDK